MSNYAVLGAGMLFWMVIIVGIAGFLGAIVLRGAAWIAVRKLELPYWRAFGLVVLCTALGFILNLLLAGIIGPWRSPGSQLGIVNFINLIVSLFVIYAPICGFLIRMPIGGADPRVQQSLVPDVPQQQLPPGASPSAPSLPPPMIFGQAAPTGPIATQPIGYARGLLVGMTYFGIWLAIGAVVAIIVFALGSFIKF